MKRYLLLAAAAAVLIGGCAKESSRPTASGEGTVRAINTISTSPNFGFLIEERFIEQVRFKTATSASTWDNLDYTFNFDALLAGDVERTRVASIDLKVERDRDYTLVLNGAIDAPDITVWEADVREWQETETNYEVRIGNTSTVLGPVDVYFEPTGTPPAAGNKIGTVGFGEILPAEEFPQGEYSLILTAVDEPGTVLYESVALTLAERTSYILSPFDADANDVGPVPVLLINTTLGGGGSVADVNTQSTARFVHASRDMVNADIYIDDPLTTPLVSDQAFGEYTADIPIASGESPITYTAAGNMGSILIDADRTFSIGAHHTLVASRNADGEDVASNYVLDRRSVETQAKLTLINTSVDNAAVDVYLLREDETLEDTFPLIPLLRTLTPPSTLPILPDQYDVYLTLPAEKTVLAGPLPLDAAAGDVFEGLIFDTVDPNVPRLEFIPLGAAGP